MQPQIFYNNSKCFYWNITSIYEYFDFYDRHYLVLTTFCSRTIITPTPHGTEIRRSVVKLLKRRQIHLVLWLGKCDTMPRSGALGSVGMLKHVTRFPYSTLRLPSDDWTSTWMCLRYFEVEFVMTLRYKFWNIEGKYILTNITQTITCSRLHYKQFHS